MIVSLAQRCVHHPLREAVARCPECGRFFCRECVSEHDDRVLCASCLARIGRVEKGTGSVAGSIGRLGMAMFGLLIVWWFFDLLGQGLMKLPASVHEGTVWKSVSSEE